jgi:hypothetical protein
MIPKVDIEAILRAAEYVGTFEGENYLRACQFLEKEQPAIMQALVQHTETVLQLIVNQLGQSATQEQSAIFRRQLYALVAVPLFALYKQEAIDREIIAGDEVD